MYCTRCGTRNLDTDQSCRVCNAPLVRPERPNVPSNPAQPPYPYSTAGSQPPQQQPSQNPPYPGYQGYPVQSNYPNQTPINQANPSGRAIAAMVLSIAALPFFCCFPASIVGIVLGKQEMNAIEEGRAPLAGETMAKVGFYLGIVATAISVLAWGLFSLASVFG